MTSHRIETLAEGVTLISGDCLDVLKTLESNSTDACVTDPPYGLEFMGKEWDAPWQVSSSSALFGKRQTKMPGWSTTRNPTCKRCGGRLRGARKCSCETPTWDEAPNETRLRQMSGFQDWCQDWAEQVYRVLKPGAQLLAFGGTRTYHRMVCAIEDAGFEIRDLTAWMFGQGFPKSLNVAIGFEQRLCVQVVRDDRKVWVYRDGGADMVCVPPFRDDDANEWAGWGTAFKPALEPIVLARKPLSESTVAANVLKWGTGGLNIDGCRVGTDDVVTVHSRGANGAFPKRPTETSAEESGRKTDQRKGAYGRDGEASAERRYIDEGSTNFAATPGPRGGSSSGRWPANVIHDGSEEVIAAFPSDLKSGKAVSRSQDTAAGYQPNAFGTESRPSGVTTEWYGDEGSAARFFYAAKADHNDRIGSKHPTVKPIDLMQYLCRLVGRKGALILDPFAGTGTTGEACIREGMRAVLIEREAEYCDDIRRRMRLAMCGPAEREREAIKHRMKDRPVDAGPLFARPLPCVHRGVS